MEMSYNLEEWAAATTRGRHIFNYNYHMWGNEIRGWELVKSVTMGNPVALRQTVYMWERKRNREQEIVRIDVVELDNWRNAQYQLLDQLRHSMRPDIPQGSGRLGKIGDVNFLAEESDVVAALSFSRGNMTVSIISVGNKPVNVSTIASRIDQDFNEPPKDEDVKRQLVELVAMPAVQVEKDVRTTLIETLPEPVARSGWLKIIAPDGELRRENNTIVYVSDQAGEKIINQFVKPTQ